MLSSNLLAIGIGSQNFRAYIVLHLYCRSTCKIAECWKSVPQGINSIDGNVWSLIEKECFPVYHCLFAESVLLYTSKIWGI